MKSLGELISELPADRKAKVLARAEELVAAERRGRSAPESNRNAAATIACVLIGAVLGVVLLIAVVVLSP